MLLTAEDVAQMRARHETGGVDGWRGEILVSSADYARIVATLEALMRENARLKEDLEDATRGIDFGGSWLPADKAEAIVERIAATIEAKEREKGAEPD
jgi:hypothetical protein